MERVKRINLWNGNPPSTNGLLGDEIVDTNAILEVTNVTQAELVIYKPEPAINTGVVVLICPGGAYAGLAITSQGYDFAEWLNTLGITGAVLKYRMPNGHKEIPLDDIKKAYTYIYDHADELGVNPQKIGITGFSAGGHLAALFSTLATKQDKLYRPIFSILFYPVISMKEYKQQDTYQNLLGESASLGDIDLFSCEHQVNVNTPPTLLLVSDDDTVVDPKNSEIYHQALKNNGIAVDLHRFKQGDHAWGIKGYNMFGEEFQYIEEVKQLLQSWLNKYH